MKNSNTKWLKGSLKSQQDGVNALSKSLAAIERAVGLLKNRKGRIIVTGVGKSAFIGMKLAATLTSLGEHAHFLHPVDALHGDAGVVTKDDCIIAISYSGESKEVVQLVSYILKVHKIKIISITGNSVSSLGKISDIVVLVSIKHEGSPLNLAPMASTTASLVAGDLIAGYLAHLRGFKPINFARSHPGGSLGKSLTKIKEVMLTGAAVPTVPDSAALKEALQVMTSNGRGVTGVINKKGEIVGIITDGDVRRHLLMHDNLKGKATAIMNKKPKTISAEKNLAEAIVEMEKWRITSLFVVDNKHRPVGLAHMHDILERSV